MSIAPAENNIMTWFGFIFGPVDTPFEDGIFKFQVKISKTSFCLAPYFFSFLDDFQ